MPIENNLARLNVMVLKCSLNVHICVAMDYGLIFT